MHEGLRFVQGEVVIQVDLYFLPGLGSKHDLFLIYSHHEPGNRSWVRSKGCPGLLERGAIIIWRGLHLNQRLFPPYKG